MPPQELRRGALAALNGLNFAQRQRLMRLLVEEVRVTGHQLDIRLRIALDDGPDRPGPGPDRPPGPTPSRSPASLSTEDRLRSVALVSPAEQDQVVELGVATVRPVDNVVGVGALRRAVAAWEATAAVAPPERSPERSRHHPLLATSGSASPEPSVS